MISQLWEFWGKFPHAWRIEYRGLRRGLSLERETQQATRAKRFRGVGGQSIATGRAGGHVHSPFDFDLPLSEATAAKGYMEIKRLHQRIFKGFGSKVRAEHKVG